MTYSQKSRKTLYQNAWDSLGKEEKERLLKLVQAGRIGNQALISRALGGYAWWQYRSRFKARQDAMDTAANGRPVDAHILRDGAAGQTGGEPAHNEVEVFGKTAARIGPGDVRNQDTVLRTLDAMGMVLDFHKDAFPVQSTPGARKL